MKKLNIIFALAALLLPDAIHAGTWEPEVGAKCPVESCDDNNGSITVGYDTAYLFYGVHVARDGMWGDVNYTFDLAGLDLNVGVWHYTSLGSGFGVGNDGYGDETDFYTELGLPSVAGFDLAVGYRLMTYATTRPPTAIGGFGDSQGEVIFTVSRDLIAGFSGSYRVAYDYNVYDFQRPGSDRSGAWVHTLGLNKSIALNDKFALDLSGGVLYTDNYWQSATGGPSSPYVPGVTRETGWNNYYMSAALPFAIGKCATLTPYISYNGSPDTWVADGATTVTGGNGSDVLYGGVSLGVTF